VNVLIAPGTTLIAKEMCNSLSFTKTVNLYGAGFDLVSAANFPYLAFDFLDGLDLGLPVGRLEEIVSERGIDYIVFAHDSWIYNFRNIDSIGNAKIVNQLKSAVNIASFKSQTYSHLQGIVPTPTVFLSITDVKKFPIFVKPDRGQGSVGALKINDESEACKFLDIEGTFDKKWVATEFLPGTEFTVDCFSNDKSEVLYSSTRIRSSIESGLAVETRIIDNHENVDLANLISEKLGIIGPWFFQLKEDVNKSQKLMEIGLRVAGGSGVQRLKGVNLPLLQLLQAQNLSLQVINQKVFPIQFANNFDLNFTYETIYVDYDDTLILHSQINRRLFLFLEEQSLGGIKIVLISRHQGNLIKSLEMFNLVHLFRDVIHITNGDPKSKYIKTEKKFLFIDDSFRERMDIHIKYGDQVLVLDESFMVR